ncbi:MAG: hypothetical protein ACR2QE_20315 [Acidimicrobiales bacterium]
MNTISFEEQDRRLREREERGESRHHRSGPWYWDWRRPPTKLGRFSHRLMHWLWDVSALVFTVTMVAVFVAATVAAWRWVFSVLG